MWTFVNLGIITLIIAVIIGLKMHLRWWNSVLALLSTIAIVVGSAFLYTPSYGYGGWLMGTVPASPVIFVSLWIAYSITGWFGRLKSRPRIGRPSFGRPQPGE